MRKMSMSSAEKERAMVLEGLPGQYIPRIGPSDYARDGIDTYDWGRRPLGCQSRSSSASVMVKAVLVGADGERRDGMDWAGRGDWATTKQRKGCLACCLLENALLCINCSGGREKETREDARAEAKTSEDKKRYYREGGEEEEKRQAWCGSRGIDSVSGNSQGEQSCRWVRSTVDCLPLADPKG